MSEPSSTTPQPGQLPDMGEIYDLYRITEELRFADNRTRQYNNLVIDIGRQLDEITRQYREAEQNREAARGLREAWATEFAYYMDWKSRPDHDVMMMNGQPIRRIYSGDTGDDVK